MLVECKHFSTLYPSGGQRIGDVFELTNEQTLHFESLGWVRRLPESQQRRLRLERIGKNAPAKDLSNRKMFIRKR